MAEKKKTTEKKAPDQKTLKAFKAKLAAKASAKKAETKPEKKAKAVKEVKMYPISTLLKSDVDDDGYLVDDQLIKLSSKDLPRVEHPYGGTLGYPQTLTEDVVVVSEVYTHYNNIIYLTFSFLSNPDAMRSVYLPKNFQYSKIDDPKLLKRFEKWKLDNLDKQLYHDWEIGSDPEIFVEDKKGQMIPAFLFLGSKEKPDYTPDHDPFNYKGGKPMYWDGFQAEFTTHADSCLGWHMDSIAAGMYGVYRAAQKKFPDAKLSLKSVYDIPPELLQKTEMKYVQFGCMPSINAYGIKVRMPPARKVAFRSAGGHLHFGIGKTKQDDAIPIVKALDGILGVACVSMFAKYDDPKRRRLYGVPGEFRLPKHGLEYRPLSNAWLCHPFIANLVIDVARNVVVLGQKGLYDTVWKATEQEVLDCIIQCDVKKARKILARNKETFLKLLKASYNEWADDKDLEFLYSVFAKGMDSFIKDPSDIATNWGLDRGWISHSGGDNMNVQSAIEHRDYDGNKVEKI